MSKQEPKQIKILPKAKLQTWLEKLDHLQIYAPVRREGYSEFAEIRDLSELDLTLRNTVLPPKGNILPHTQTMLKYDIGKTPPTLDAGLTGLANAPQRLLLGIRPCDTRGFAAIDLTFDSEFKDPYYLSARDRTIIVGLACNAPGIDINCFCTSVGSGPHDGSAMDILMIDNDPIYVFNIYTEKGMSIVDRYQDLFDNATPEHHQVCEGLRAAAEAVNTREMAADGVDRLLEDMFEANYWEKISRKCLGCGICTFVCPTCYCFDITDEKRGSKGERVRTWDSCMYAEYTVHASGYNPRPARVNRLRNRVYHKFKYYPDLYSKFGCTGCGRCIRQCPVNIDIIDIINGIKEAH